MRLLRDGFAAGRGQHALAQRAGRSSSTRTATRHGLGGLGAQAFFFRTGTFTLHRSTPPAERMKKSSCRLRATPQIGGEGRAPRVHDIEGRALSRRDVARQPDRGDRHVLAFFLVEAERFGPARQ